ncbi:MAG TPA: glycosyltransferase [Terriglobales bacterium]|nr:glycosyltransferase [Terriglobales bacterium]
MKILIFGLSITSSWGNGHATTYRSLAKALKARGHELVFFEHDLEWYASNRDMPEPPFCRVCIYETWKDALPKVRRHLQDCDVAMVGSYFPDSADAINEVLESRVPVKAFYDIDTPITVGKLRAGGAEYLNLKQVGAFDLYFSFTGGPLLNELETRFGAQRAVPLYCSFDPEQYRPCPSDQFACDMSYMGTYATDRQPTIERLLCDPARSLPWRKFVVAGPQYPEDLKWPYNVERIIHLEPKFHATFYSSSRITLNVTRKDMALAGYSPSVRLFEAAACGATIVSDRWEGIETFLTPGSEILIPESASNVVEYLQEMDESELRTIGRCARERVSGEHTAQHRAEEFEQYVNDVCPLKELESATPTAESA